MRHLRLHNIELSIRTVGQMRIAAQLPSYSGQVFLQGCHLSAHMSGIPCCGALPSALLSLPGIPIGRVPRRSSLRKGRRIALLPFWLRLILVDDIRIDRKESMTAINTCRHIGVQRNVHDCLHFDN